jgi:hypothetical protein
MEYLWLIPIVLAWFWCGLLGYSMFSGSYARQYHMTWTYTKNNWHTNKLYTVCEVVLSAIFGPYVVVMVFKHRKWTEKDGMWL